MHKHRGQCHRDNVMRFMYGLVQFHRNLPLYGVHVHANFATPHTSPPSPSRLCLVLQVKKATSIRKQLTTEQLAKKELEDEEKRLIAEAHREGPKSNRDLRGEAHQMRQEELAKPRDIIAEKLLEEQEIMDAMRAAKALKTAEELAFGVDYSESMPTEWRPPKWLRDRPESVNKAQRDQYMIELEGEGCPPMCARFEDMKLAPCIVDMLKSKGITKPTPIQMQGIPVLLSGRDMIGVAFTGSGKTLAFGIPAIMAAFDQEKKMPFVRGEGPYSVIMNPSRELARQTHDVLQEWAQCIEKGTGTKLCIALCMGQVDMNQYTRGHAGIHVMVATAGKLMGGLKTKRFTFELCRYFCLDEADRMIDLDQEEDIRTIFSYFKGQRQTVLFSATMPAKIRDFAKSALINHIAVTIGRSGAANLDVIQEVEYVKQEAKVMYLLECLQKTPPPVLVFSAKKGDVDDMYEYLLLKGVEAVAIHGGKDQDERDLAINSFKAGRKDVLVATDVASKGLDFAHIQHVINYDMPEELEDYIHRIGRTGKCDNSVPPLHPAPPRLCRTGSRWGTPPSPHRGGVEVKRLIHESPRWFVPFVFAYTDVRTPDDVITFRPCWQDGHRNHFHKQDGREDCAVGS